MKKSLKIAYIAAFVLLFIAPSIIYEVFGAQFDQTNFEQREAAKKPVFSLETIEQYPQAFEAYYNDTMPFRNQMISTNSLLTLRLFGVSAVDKVLIGKDGWLFFNPEGSDGDPIQDYLGSNLLTQDQLEMFARNLLEARESLAAQGKEFVVMIVPNKVCVYGDQYLPDLYATNHTYTQADHVAAYLQKNTDLTVVYPKEAILSSIARNPEYDYYYKTDTHWNALGAYVGVRELLKSVNVELPPLEELQIIRKGQTTGDLITMAGLTDHYEYDDEYELGGLGDGQEVTEFYPVEGNSDLVCYSTDAADERSVFVVRDSFSVGMMPYISGQFNHSCFVHINAYSPEMLSEYPSDIVVLQVVERYIWNLNAFRAS